MAFVLDCSVTMSWLFPDESTEAINRLRDTLIDSRAFAPSLWPAEVGNALLVATRRGRIHADDWPQVRGYLSALPIEIDALSVSRTWGASLELARTHHLSLYDATYLELAARLRIPLATLDRALRNAAIAVGVDVPELTQ